MDKVCGGFVEIHDGKYKIIQFDPTIWNTGSFGIWDNGGDEIILTIIEYSKYNSEKVFRVLKQDSMTPEGLEIFNTYEHPKNVVYITPSIHSSIQIPDNIKVLYSAWGKNYRVYSPPMPKVEHSIQKICFRGQPCVKIREQLFEEYKNHPLVDFKLTKGTWHPEFKNDKNRLSFDDIRKYRGIISIEGTGHPSNLEQVLGSGCVPVLHCNFLSGLQMDMKPWIHYVPLSVENVRWIFDNPVKADEIIHNAMALHRDIKFNIHKQFSRLVM